MAKANGKGMDTPVTVVVGLGEVGRPLAEILADAHRVEGIDLPPRDVDGPVGMLHVCYPGEVPDFIGVTVAYAERYSPEIVVINSTVPVGTTRAVQAVVDVPVVHSPVRGKHVRMVQEIRKYRKFIGGADKTVTDKVSEHFEAAGLETRVLSTPEATELAKLTETTYFGLLIAFAQDVERMSRQEGVAYEEVITFYEEIGYLPPVKFFPGVIGGHCVMPNIALLRKTFSSELLEAIQWSNEIRVGEGVEEERRDAQRPLERVKL